MDRFATYWRAGFVVCSLAAALTVRAQNAASNQSNAPAPTATAGTAPQDQEVVALPAFDVTGDAAHGYVASESITGTRVASKIEDLPFAVNVVTADFMNDLGLFTTSSQLGFVSGFSPSEVTGQFQLRGFASPVTLVDGFRRLGTVDVVDIDRIEVIKGTEGSIYGAVPPGGAVNYITRQPSATPTQEITFGAGTEQYARGTLYSSGPLGASGKLFYSLDASDQTNAYPEEFATKHISYVSGKLLFKPDDATSLKLDIEHTEDYEHPFEQALTVTEKQTMPWAGDGITESQYYGLEGPGSGLLDYNYAGPESYEHIRETSVTLEGEHQFNEVYSIRAAVNGFTNPYNDQLVGSGAYYPYGTGNVTVANGVVQQPFTPEVKDQPQVDWKPQRGGGGQIDNLFAFSAGPVKNKLLLTTDYYEVSQRQLTIAGNSGVTQATDYYALYSPYNPSGASYYTPGSSWPAAFGYGWNTTLYGVNPTLYNDITTDSWTAFSDYGVFGSEQASLWNDRVILMGGGRFDYVRNQIANYNIPGPGGTSYAVNGPEPTPYQAFDYNTQGWTYQIGTSIQVVDGVHLYADKSTGFNPQPQIDSYTGLALPNNTSNGYEAGVKTALLNGRLNITADYFLINEYNLAQSETDPVTGIKDTILSGHEQSKGTEFDGTFAVTNDLFLQLDWGHANAKVLDASPLTFLNGLPIRRVPRNNWGAVAHYQFSSGFARGVYVYGGMNYYSKSLINLGSGKSLDPGPAATTTNSTLSMYYVPSTNLTYIGSDPKLTGEVKLSNPATPFYNVPFPGNGQLPYPSLPANAYINYPVTTNGTALPAATGVTVPSGDTVYVGEPSGVFVDDGRENIYNAPYCIVLAGTGYTWKTGMYTHKLQVNISNLLNRKYTYGSGAPGLPFTTYVQYSLGF